jgi:CubicO group peptidase (beta-lactamase class C family)
MPIDEGRGLVHTEGTTAMSRSALKTASCYLSVSLAFAAPSLAQDPAARMDQVVRSYVDARQFMGSVLVARGDKVLFNQAYGSANLEWNTPDTTSTKFRIGSMTKQFTAAAVLLLEERGKLKVDDPVKRYYPDAPAAWDNITLFHLLTHTSGIPNHTSFPEFESLSTLRTTPDQLVKSFRDRPLEFVPGAEMRYSNSNYVLLGAIIEKAGGTSYESFVTENLFKPLGMNDSGYDSTQAIIARRAAGYGPGPAGPVNARYIDMTVPYAAGALYSTTGDLLRWERSLFGGKVLSSASLEKMTTPFRNDYAFGLEVSRKSGRRVIQHGGSINGFSSRLAYFPDDEVTVIALSNLRGPGADGIVEKLGALAHGETVVLPSERKEVAVPTEVLKRYVGTYAIAPGVAVAILLDGEHLFAQMTGQQRLQLFAQSETSFFMKAVEVQVDFVKDASGAVTHLVSRQGGHDTDAKRVTEDMPVTPPPPAR